jgi:glycosyltransferase
MKITIITCTLNSDKTLEKALISLYGQTYKNFEHIIIDSGSSDETVNIIRNFQDYRTRVFQSHPKGIYAALNTGLTKAIGDLIGVLHSDDFFTNSTILEKVAQAFISTQSNVIYGNINYVKRDNPGEVVRKWKSSEITGTALLTGWTPPHTATFIEKKRFGHYRYDEKYKISADYDYLLTIFFDKNCKCEYLDLDFVNMRIGGVSTSGLQSEISKVIEDLSIIHKYKLLSVFTLFFKKIRKLRQFLKTSCSDDNSLSGSNGQR